ncbi:MAG: DUF3301 domain-containing protein [Steroidobacteraceae bacterium]
MELSWSLLLFTVLLGALALFWHAALGARDLANAVARETCASTGAALLDGTVAFRSMRVVRGDAGRPALERTYLFDYSHDGVTVRQGFVVVSGRRVESIGLQ